MAGIPDADDIRELYRREHQRMERQIARRIGSSSVARDLVHDIFLRLMDRAEVLRTNPAAFLGKAARNAAIDYLRKERVRGQYVKATDQTPDLGDPSYEQLERRRQVHKIAEVVNQLPEMTRRLFILNRVHGHSFSQLARDNGMSERNVAKHMARALAACSAAVDEREEQA